VEEYAVAESSFQFQIAKSEVASSDQHTIQKVGFVVLMEVFMKNCTIWVSMPYSMLKGSLLLINAGFCKKNLSGLSP
jgi:hypothetical protein